MEPIFDWDEDKADTNLQKHQVSFTEASTVFGDPLSTIIGDPQHSHQGEDRYLNMGRSIRGRLLVVVYTVRGSVIRLISCRRATQAERRIYEEGRE
jgi:uncharacterized protein